MNILSAKFVCRVVQIIFLLCSIEYYERNGKKVLSRYANEQNRKSKHVKHVHTSQAQHKRAAPRVTSQHFSSLCQTRGASELSVQRQEDTRSRTRKNGVIPTPGILPTSARRDFRADLLQRAPRVTSTSRGRETDSAVSGVPSISWRVVAGPRYQTLEVSPRSIFPDVLSRAHTAGSSSFQSVAGQSAFEAALSSACAAPIRSP